MAAPRARPQRPRPAEAAVGRSTAVGNGQGGAERRPAAACGRRNRRRRILWRRHFRRARRRAGVGADPRASDAPPRRNPRDPAPPICYSGSSLETASPSPAPAAGGEKNHDQRRTRRPLQRPRAALHQLSHRAAFLPRRRRGDLRRVARRASARQSLVALSARAVLRSPLPLLRLQRHGGAPRTRRCAPTRPRSSARSRGSRRGSAAAPLSPMSIGAAARRPACPPTGWSR